MSCKGCDIENLYTVQNPIYLYSAAGVFLVRPAGENFAKYFVLIVLANFILYLISYSIAKCVFKERPSIKALIYSFLAIIIWIPSIYFFTRVSAIWELLDTGSSSTAVL